MAEFAAPSAQSVERRANRCKKCEGDMQPGVAIRNTLTGMPDFPGDRHATTVSPGGPGKLIDCMKCTACGWSVTGSPVSRAADRDNLKELASYHSAMTRVHGNGTEVRNAWAAFTTAVDNLLADE